MIYEKKEMYMEDAMNQLNAVELFSKIENPCLDGGKVIYGLKHENVG